MDEIAVLAGRILALQDPEQGTQLSCTWTPDLQDCEVMGVVLSLSICGNLLRSGRKLLQT